MSDWQRGKNENIETFFIQGCFPLPYTHTHTHTRPTPLSAQGLQETPGRKRYHQKANIKFCRCYCLTGCFIVVVVKRREEIRKKDKEENIQAIFLANHLF